MTKPLPHELSGNKSSDSLVVFLHGYPDLPAIWDRIIPSIEPDSYILNVSYPNYSKKEFNPKGADFDVLVERIKVTIDQVNDTNRRVVVVIHDWGSFLGFMLDQKYPGYLSQIISLDIGIGTKNTPFQVFYQIFLAIAFLIGGIIGNFMTKIMLSKGFKYSPPWLDRIDSSWNYSYYYLWKKHFQGMLDKRKGLLAGYSNSCPVVFLWGTKKPYQFFGKDWIDELGKDPKNEVHAVDSAHWIMVDQAKFLIDVIRRRLRLIK